MRYAKAAAGSENGTRSAIFELVTGCFGCYNDNDRNAENEMEGIMTMKKKLFVLTLAAAMLLSLLGGCGSPTQSEASDPGASAEASVEPDTSDAPPVEEPASAEEPENTGVEHQYNFPNSENALLDYTNEYSLPLCEETETITWMRNAVNLTGPLANLGINSFQDMEYIQHLQEITNVNIEFTELDFFTSQEKIKKR